MGLVWEDESSWGEVLVSGLENGVQHGFVEKEVSHPFRDDDIDLVNWQHDILQLSLDQGDLVVQSVDVYNLASLLNDGGHVDGVNMLCTGLSGEPVQSQNPNQTIECSVDGHLHAENRSSTSNIQHNLVLEEVLVLVDGVLVGVCSDLIFLITKRFTLAKSNIRR